MLKTKFHFLQFAGLIFLQIISIDILNAQDTIYLRNPSFEDVPRKGGEFSPPIKEWHDCGLVRFPGESPPDIHPVYGVPGNAWEVSKKAYDGKTYLGLVTRYSDTYESVSQKLDKPIESGKCYTLSIFLAKSDDYKSRTQRSRNELENFIQPVECLIWGGDDFCSHDQLLVHSGPVSNSEWKEYRLTFSPNKSYQYFTIGAFFEYGYLTPYNGHILVDALSPIVEVKCQ